MDTQAKDQFGFKGKIKTELFDLSGNPLETKEYNNLCVNASKVGFAKLLNSESGFTGKINYGAVGTNGATPAAGDTQLGTELARAVIETQSRAGQVVTITFYFGPTVGNGTLLEFGAFIDGTAAANSGTLWDLLNMNVVKTSLNSLRITLTASVV